MTAPAPVPGSIAERCLVALRSFVPGLTTTTLAEMVGASLSSTSQAVTRLVTLGLATKTQTDADYTVNRAVRVVPPAPASGVRLAVVGPGFERGAGERRHWCANYVECVRAYERFGQGRCPSACSGFEEADRSFERDHEGASRRGERA